MREIQKHGPAHGHLKGLWNFRNTLWKGPFPAHLDKKAQVYMRMGKAARKDRKAQIVLLQGSVKLNSSATGPQSYMRVCSPKLVTYCAFI
jgi:hypothetical protein